MYNNPKGDARITFQVFTSCCLGAIIPRCHELEEIIQWMSKERKMFPDVSMCSFVADTSNSSLGDGMDDVSDRKRLEAELISLAIEFPFLGLKRLSPGDHNGEGYTALTNAEKGFSPSGDSKNIENEASIIAPDQDLKNRVICAGFTVPTTKEHPVIKYPHVVVVQRPYVPLAEGSDGLVRGPIQPLPVGVEFHLHEQLGDALHIKNTLMKPLNSDVYENLIHTDGELYTLFGPAEGASIDDIEATIEGYEQAGLNYYDSQSPFPNAVSATVGEGSKYPYLIVPRCMYNIPDGKVKRRTPLEGPKMTLRSEHPTDDMLRSVIASVKFYCQAVLNKGVCQEDDEYNNNGSHTPSQSPVRNIYKLDWSKMCFTLPQEPIHACNFCARRRGKLLRCSGCRVARYCCKEHQVLDWNGNHSSECTLLKIAHEDYASLRFPHFNKMLKESENGNVESADVEAILETYSKEQDEALLNLGFSKGLNDASNETEIEMNAKISRAKSSCRTLRALMTTLSSNGESSDFLSALEKKTCEEEERPYVIHLLNIEDPYLFLSAFEEDVRQHWLPSEHHRQLRILLVAPQKIKKEDQNKVFFYESNTCTFDELKPTGVLGDIWHVGGTNNLANKDRLRSFILIRLSNEKYKDLSDNASLAPNAIYGIGGVSYDGLTFFHTSSSVLANNFLGRIPIGFAEPHYVTCHRTIRALSQRVDFSSTCPLMTDGGGVKGVAQYFKKITAKDGNGIWKNHVVSSRSKGIIEEVGMCIEPLTPSKVVEINSAESLPRLPLHCNAYCFVFMPL